MANSERNSWFGLHLVLLIMIACTVGCGNDHTPVPQVTEEHTHIEAPQPFVQTEAGAPLGFVPFPANLDRDVSGIAVEMVAGSDYENDLASMNVLPGDPGDPIQFQPATGGNNMAFAIYHLRRFEWTEFALITSEWSMEPSQWENLWIGATDWNLGGWKWFEGRSMGQIGALDRLFDAQGHVYIAVVLLGDEPATLDLVQFKQGWAGPVANLAISPQSGTEPLVVRLDGSGSYSSQGKIAKYIWSFMDGSPSQETSSPVTYHTFTTYAQHQYFTPKLTAVDEEGSSASVYGDLVGLAYQNSGIVKSTYPYGIWDYDYWAAGPFEVLGNPAIILLVEDEHAPPGEPKNTIQYSRALDSGGTLWSEPVTVGELDYFHEGNVTDKATAIVGNAPAFVYLNGTGSFLFARANNALGQTWGAPTLITSGLTPKLYVIDSKPVILFTGHHEWYSEGIWICFARDNVGSSWNPPVRITSEVGAEANLVMLDGIPAVGWGHDTLYFCIAKDESGLTWNPPVEVYSTSAPDYQDISSHLMAVNGLPVFGVWVTDSRGSDLAFTLTAEDAQGQNWDDAYIVDSGITAPGESTFVVFRGGPDPHGNEKVAAIFFDHTLVADPDGAGNPDWENARHINTYDIAENSFMQTTPDFLETGWFWLTKYVSDNGHTVGTDRRVLWFKTLATLSN